MNKLSRAAIALIAAATSTLVLSTSAASAASNADKHTGIATFEGKKIDLRRSWGEATACLVDQQGDVRCYRTEKEMDFVIAAQDSSKGPQARAAACSSSVRLYRNTSWGSSVLYLSQRNVWINASWYGFNNITSSYKVGACSSVFRSLNNGGGSSYFGSTSTWASASSMGSWDNYLSSVWIY